MKREVIRVELVTTEMFVPQRVVAKSFSRFFSNFRVLFILDGVSSDDFLIFLGLAAISAISEPEKNASRVRNAKNMIVYNKMSIVVVLLLFQFIIKLVIDFAEQFFQ